jgi:hypothetical protein
VTLPFRWFLPPFDQPSQKNSRCQSGTQSRDRLVIDRIFDDFAGSRELLPCDRNDLARIFEKSARGFRTGGRLVIFASYGYH